MKRFASTVMMLAAITSASAVLAAAPPRGPVSDLQGAQAKLDRFASRINGGAQQRLLLERERIQTLIDDLEAGKKVDPQDIDRALRNAEHPF